MEPYIELVRNRNQRSSLTRLRISAHTLATELLRRTRPVTPYHRRLCAYCQSMGNNFAATEKFIDSEQHFIMSCERFKNMRRDLFTEISYIIPGFKDLSNEQKFKTLMCPTSPQIAKSVNRYIKSMFQKREQIDAGTVTGDLWELKIKAFSESQRNCYCTLLDIGHRGYFFCSFEPKGIL